MTAVRSIGEAEDVGGPLHMNAGRVQRRAWVLSSAMIGGRPHALVMALGLDLLVEGRFGGIDDLIEKSLYAYSPLLDSRAVSKVHARQPRPTPTGRRREGPATQG